MAQPASVARHSPAAPASSGSLAVEVWNWWIRARLGSEEPLIPIRVASVQPRSLLALVYEASLDSVIITRPSPTNRANQTKCDPAGDVWSRCVVPRDPNDRPLQVISTCLTSPIQAAPPDWSHRGRVGRTRTDDGCS